MMRQNELLYEFVQIRPNHLDHSSLLGIRPFSKAKSVFDRLRFGPFCHTISLSFKSLSFKSLSFTSGAL
jgi:hypothetical protein